MKQYSKKALQHMNNTGNYDTGSDEDDYGEDDDLGDYGDEEELIDLAQ